MGHDHTSPSPRYGSVPKDGPAAGKKMEASWETLQKSYYKGMGWDPETGAPTVETMRTFGLEEFL